MLDSKNVICLVTQQSKAAKNMLLSESMCVYLSTPMVFFSMSLKSLAPKAKVLDLQSTGYNTFSVALMAL